MTESVTECKADRNCVPCEVYSRVVGYLRPVANWNDGKKAEHRLRKFYNLAGGAQPEPRAPDAA